jgi:hypothetical protein
MLAPAGGSYKPMNNGITDEIGTADVIQEMTILKNYSFADKSFELRNGSVQVLNIPKEMGTDVDFFDVFNKDLLDLAVDNPTKVRVTLISDPRKENLLWSLNTNTGILENTPSGFAKEIKYLRERGISTVYLKDGTQLNLNDIHLYNLNWSKWKY